MLERNILAPFKFARGKKSYIFVFQYAKVEDPLALMQQLKRASTLVPVEQNGMIAAISYSMQKRSPFDHCWLDTALERILLEVSHLCNSVQACLFHLKMPFQTEGHKITPLVVNPGRILLSDVTLYFQPYNNAESVPVFKVKLDSIKRIFQRRYFDFTDFALKFRVKMQTLSEI